MKILIDYNNVKDCYNVEFKKVNIKTKFDLKQLGFWKEDIEKIINLKINDEVIIEDMCGILKIKRIA